MIERCGDRQRKCDGLQKWHFHLFVESLPVMLQVALLLLALGLWEHIRSINALIGYILIALTMLGTLFYTVIVIMGASSYECPFQTPVSVGLRSVWEKIGPHVTAALNPITTASRSLCERLPRPPAVFTLRRVWEVALSRILHVLPLPLVETGPHPHHSPLPTLQPSPRGPPSPLVPLYSLWKNIQCILFRVVPRLLQNLPLSTVQDISADFEVTSP